MKTIYFDCGNGISGDMAYEALKGLLPEGEKPALEEIGGLAFHGSGGGHDGNSHSHSSYGEIKDLIEESHISESAKEKALSIYSVIAEAEAFVHGTAAHEVRFHEVGRIEAVRNIVGAAVCVDALGAGKILCSKICDGKGFIESAHGTIPVPVPAVMAMRGGCGLEFSTDENVGTEMVTPSGLAILIGLGAEYAEAMPEGETLGKAVACGKRKTGRDGGLAVFLLNVGGN